MYKIYEINIKANVILNLCKHTFWTSKPKLKTLIKENVKIDTILETVVLDEREIGAYIDKRNNKTYDDWLYNLAYYLRSFKDGYNRHRENPYSVENMRISFKEIDFNSKNIKHWIEKLNSKDLILILNQEQIDCIKLLQSL
jgi:hypothetical protein